MIPERASGLIVRTYPLTETSLIVHWLTADAGRLATVAKGARRPKSPFRGKLDLFYLADFSFQRSARSELHTLREVVLRQTYPALRQDLALLQQAAYCAALIEQSTENDTPLPVQFALLHDLVRDLAQPAPGAQAPAAAPVRLFAFELKLLAEAGLQSNPRQEGLSAGACQLVEKLVHLDWLMLPRLKPSPAQIAEISRHLQSALSRHLGRVPAGREAALGRGVGASGT